MKSKIVSLPIIGNLLLVCANIVRLPQIRQRQEEHLRNLDSSVISLAEQSTKISEQLTELNDKLEGLQAAQDTMHQQVSMIEKGTQVKTGGAATQQKRESSDVTSNLFANDHLLDIFYTNFEDKFRGDEKTIEENLKVYLPHFKNAKVDFNKNTVLDIGSGRGEMLSVLKKNDIPALGLDINIDMVERANTKGLVTRQGDALSFLEDTKSQTYGAITGFHLVEHVPFALLLRIFKESRRCLVNDGFVIFETPNPENVVVGSTTFYYDPSHLHPLPPMLLAYALETCGFRNVEILRLHPDSAPKSIQPEVAKYFYGPRDYAVIGYK